MAHATEEFSFKFHVILTRFLWLMSTILDSAGRETRGQIREGLVSHSSGTDCFLVGSGMFSKSCTQEII